MNLFLESYTHPAVISALLNFVLQNSKNLEHITNIFFNQRRKKIKKPLKFLFKDVNEISKKLKINIDDRPQNLSTAKYIEICNEYEKLVS